MHEFPGFRSAVALITFLVAAIASPIAAQDQEQDPENIGFVLYTKTTNPGTLIARWNYQNRYYGPGLATGGPIEGFEGNYHVRYFFENGEFSDEYDLEIVQTGTFYDVIWRVDGEIQARGVGMLVEDGTALAAGWRRVNE